MMKNFHLIGLSVVILCCIYLAYREFKKINEKFININNQINDLRQVTSSNLIEFNQENKNTLNDTGILKKNININDSVDVNSKICTNTLEKKYGDYQSDSESDSDSEEEYDEYSFNNPDEKKNDENTKNIELQNSRVNIDKTSYDTITKVEHDSEIVESDSEIVESDSEIVESDSEIVELEKKNLNSNEIYVSSEAEFLNSADITPDDNMNNMGLYSNMIVDLKNEINNIDSGVDDDEVLANESVHDEVVDAPVVDEPVVDAPVEIYEVHEDEQYVDDEQEDDESVEEDLNNNFHYIEQYTVKQLRNELMKYKTKVPSKVKRGGLIEMLRVELNN